MKVTVERLPKNQAKLTIELEPAELQPHLETSAKQISERIEFPGFRKGKVPFDIVKQKFGEAALYQDASEEIVRHTYPEAVLEQKLETIGHPQISLEKVAPGNPFIYTAVVALLPEVTLGEYHQLKAKRKEVQVEPKEVEKTLDELRWMRSKEAIVDRAAKEGDRVVIDIQLSIDGVNLENGSSKDQSVILGRHQVVPGLEEQLIGVIKDQTKKFQLPYPKEYYQKNLAGKLVDFNVKVKDIYQIDLPVIDDAFAKALGQFENKAGLEKQIHDNLVEEARTKEQQKFELTMLKEIIGNSTFGEIPDALVESELDRMISELRHGVAEQGLPWDEYLNQLKKTETDLKKEFTPQAIERIKSALVLRAIQKQEKLEVSEAEVDAEIEKQKQVYQNDLPTYNKVDSPEYRDYLNNVLMNRKVFEFLETIAYPKSAAKK